MKSYILLFSLCLTASCEVTADYRKQKKQLTTSGDVHTEPCINKGTILLVDSSSRIMHLCKDDNVDRTYFVGLGENGVGKKVQGDKKTPLGRYTLGKPRKSNGGFNIFIHVGYPTRQQRNEGYTGGLIGVHGPQRDWKDYPEEYNIYGTQDWTLGCIAVGTDQDIEEIALWVDRNKVRTIIIE